MTARTSDGVAADDLLRIVDGLHRDVKLADSAMSIFHHSVADYGQRTAEHVAELGQSRCVNETNYSDPCVENLKVAVNPREVFAHMG